MKKVLITLTLLLTIPVFAQPDPPVKMSVSGTFHQKIKTSYNTYAKKFNACYALDEYLKAGGRA